MRLFTNRLFRIYPPPDRCPHQCYQSFSLVLSTITGGSRSPLLAMLIRTFPLLAFILPFTFADVQFLTPAPGATVAADSTITVTWQDSGVIPPLSKLAGYQVFLLVGGSTEATSVDYLETIDHQIANRSLNTSK